MSSSDEAIDQPKEEPMDEETEPAFGPAFLGLHRIGTKLPPRPALPKPDTIQKLNARGMPARIRKKNKLFFDDDIVNDKPSPKQSPRKPGSVPASPSTSNSGDAVKKTPNKVSPQQTRLLKRRRELKAKRDLLKMSPSAARSSHTTELERANAQFDRKVSQKIGMRLRNLLKLPKAHKFVSYEWFYSTIDRPLFEGENDFQTCLRQSFPALKTRMLSRPEWRKIRRIMGKPRRCSQTFFDEERQELERKRQKLRVVQSRKNCDASFIQDLPTEVPLALHVGAKVTARLRSGQDGIFTGKQAFNKHFQTEINVNSFFQALLTLSKVPFQATASHSTDQAWAPIPYPTTKSTRTIPSNRCRSARSQRSSDPKSMHLTTACRPSKRPDRTRHSRPSR
jgi:protein lin-9